MIHVVTLFGDQRKQDALEIDCARENIQFVGEDFQNVQQFMESFERIDTMIDVVIISEMMLEAANKKEIFSSIQNAEPNIRIIILFPGYRNQYIEDQIKAYKEVYGITDILYEGAGIDGAYFAEVIKKGFIYDYQVNAYDEPEEVEDSPKEQECVKIGIMGLTHGCGVTNMVVAVSNYIALSQDIPVKAIDFTETGSLRFAKGKKVTYLVHSGVDVERVFKTSQAVVFDFGTPYLITPKGKLIFVEERFLEAQEAYFKECDLKICMCFSDPWHAGKMKYLWNEKQWKKEIDDSWLFVYDTSPGNVKTKYAKNICVRNDQEVEKRIDHLFTRKGGG